MSVFQQASMTLQIDWTLDIVPGFNYEPQDMGNHIPELIQGSVGHYNPTFKMIVDPHKLPNTCTHCHRVIEWNIHGKKLGSTGFCVGFDTCLQDASI